MEILFWISLFIIFYTYIGYGILIYIILWIKKLMYGSRPVSTFNNSELPTCSLVIAAYNEEAFIEKKIENTLNLNYPSSLLNVYFVTDGSTDNTPEIIKKYPEFTLLHQDERKGKVAAIDRAMTYIKSEIVIFTDANTFLNQEALIMIGKCYADKTIGGVAGEKRVHVDKKADASSAGEGFYWKYETQLKKWDSALHSVVGTAGELFSILRALYTPVPPDTILDDFMISMRIAEKGHRIVYEPKAYALETSSANVKEELKRKIRIAAGGMQAITRLSTLLNPIHQPLLSFQYISHRVLRWTITPILLILVFLLNLYLVILRSGIIYDFILYAQLIFYCLALVGWQLERKQLKLKFAFVPYYFCIMNYAVIAGQVRFFRNKQSAIWDKSKRK